jgi:hypothetical protein
VDTGCKTPLEWVLSREVAKKMGFATIGVHSRSPREIYTDVQFGSQRISSVHTGLHTVPMFAGEAGLIGNGLLSRYIVTIDSPRARCLLSPAR